ncbi:MAG: ABC transporter ATP-binding protein [Bacteroidia bacterium]|nr:ABC transporter ATP-binding protein/permease [Bacteroidia bacterium]MDW8158233.1 ABC transporter ATP-binding protein [Bacteroidia bacterium]
MIGPGTLPKSIIEVFAEILDIDYPLQEHTNDKDKKEYTITELVQELNFLGEIAGLTFLESQISTTELNQMIRKRSLPLLAFFASPYFKPFIITDYTNKKVKGITFDADWHAEIKIPLAKLQESLYTTTDTKGEVYTIIVHPLQIESLASEIDYSVDEKVEQPLTPLERLFHLLKSEKKDITYIYIYAIVVGLFSLTVPLGVQAIIGMISGGLILEPVIILIAFVIVGTLLSGFLQIMQARIVETLNQRLFAKAAFEFSWRIPKVDLEAITKEYAPELMNRFFDILTIQKGFAKLLTDILAALLQILFGLILLTFYHPLFIFFAVFLVVVLVLLLWVTGGKGLKTSLLESKYKYKVAHWLEEIARTLPTFKLAGFTSLSIEKMDEYVSNYLHKREAHFRVLITQLGGVVFFKTLTTGLVFILGTSLVIDRQITLGQFVAAELVIVGLLNAVEKVFQNMDTIFDILTALDKIGHVTDLPLDKSGYHMFPNHRNAEGIHIQLQNVFYKYPDAEHYTLKGITLEIKAGEKVGVVGLSEGAGVTTFMYLISSLLQSYEGSICYDKYSLRDININSLRDCIGDNLSLEEIFEGTIEQNISMGKVGITQRDVILAAEKVGLLPFINSLPQGLRTHLIAGGKQLPTPIIKKIILARSIVENPRLIVFDNFFENLDTLFLRDIAECIFSPEQKWTVVAATYNPIILQKCDKIIVLERGEVVDICTYEELIQNPTFAALWLPHTA